jgi:hypothetical protein
MKLMVFMSFDILVMMIYGGESVWFMMVNGLMGGGLKVLILN